MRKFILGFISGIITLSLIANCGVPTVTSSTSIRKWERPPYTVFSLERR